MHKQLIELLEDISMASFGCRIRVVHGTDTYLVVGERGKFLNVYPERELPDHPGSRYPWPAGIPWVETAASHTVMLFRRDNGYLT